MTKEKSILYFIIGLISFLVIIVAIGLLGRVVFAEETCTQGIDCLESINENTYNLQQDVNDIYEYLDIGDTEPSVLVTQDYLNDNISETLQIFGIFFGLTLFSLGFVSLGTFLYNKR